EYASGAYSTTSHNSAIGTQPGRARCIRTGRRRGTRSSSPRTGGRSVRDAIRDGSGQRIRYAERDAIGVEASGDTAGINAELVYLREQHARQTLEHDEDGHHDTTQVARVFLECVDKGVGDLVLTERSYAGGVYSDSVASISRIGTGAYQIQLA